MANDDESVGRVHDAVRRAAGTVGAARDRVTGQDLARTVTDYSETYAQVLLGQQDDIDAMSRRLGTLERQLTEASKPESRPLHRRLALSFALAIVAMTIALVALGLILVQ